MSEPAVVYITNKAASHDYSRATHFGAIRFVTQGNYPVFKTGRLQEEIVTALIYSNPWDYLLFSGSGVVASLCSLVWFELHSQANILLWDRTKNSYVQRTVEREGMRMLINEMRDKLTPPGE